MQMLDRNHRVPGTIDHHTVVYEYLDGRKLMSLKQGSPEFFLWRSNNCQGFKTADIHFLAKRKFLTIFTKKTCLFSNVFHAFFGKCYSEKTGVFRCFFFSRVKIAFHFFHSKGWTGAAMACISTIALRTETRENSQ